MNAEEYIEKRIRQEEVWYDHAARRALYQYRIFGALAVVASAAVPVIVALEVNPWVAAVSGGLAATAIALLAFFKFQENWLNYRATWQVLVRERFLFEARAGSYRELGDDEAFARLVERVEDAIAEESSRWQGYQEAK